MTSAPQTSAAAWRNAQTNVGEPRRPRRRHLPLRAHDPAERTSGKPHVNDWCSTRDNSDEHTHGPG